MLVKNPQANLKDKYRSLGTSVGGEKQGAFFLLVVVCIGKPDPSGHS